MKNILFIGDPESIHDRKWMTWFSEKENYNCYLIVRIKHDLKMEIKGIKFINFFEDYSCLKPWRNIKTKKLINRIVDQNNIEIVHIFYAEPNLLLSLLFPPKVKLILTTRGSDVLVGIRNFIENNSLINKIILRDYQRAFSRCNSIISTSKKQLDYLIRHFELPDNLSIIRTGITVWVPSKSIQKENIIFFPRVMEPIYDHEFSVKAIHQLSSEIKKKYTFIFVGHDGKNNAYVKKIETLLTELSDCKVVFFNLLNDKEYWDWMYKSKIVVMTPKSDGSPVSGMEAIAAGCQLILPDLDYDEDLFASARFYQPGNLKDLVESIEEMSSKHSPIIDSTYLLRVSRDEQMKKVEDIYQNDKG